MIDGTNQTQSSIGGRLKVARMWLGRTVESVADELGISSRSYKYFEADEREMSALLRTKFLNALSLPDKYFDGEKLELADPAGLTFRKRAKLKSAGMQHAIAAASFVPAVISQMEDVLKLPRVTVPRVRASGKSQVERVVQHVRSSVGLGESPIGSAIEVAEALGVLVFWVETDTEFDGVSYWCQERPIILLNSRIRDGYRMRFTLMHELGHIVLKGHHEICEETYETGKRNEADANYFASAMLMPMVTFARRFSAYWSVYDCLDERKCWGASCAAIVRRAYDLCLISADRYRQHSISISTKGWRTKEPGSIEPETSKVHQWFFDEAGEFGERPSDLAMKGGNPLGWIFEICPQSRAYESEFRLN